VGLTHYCPSCWSEVRTVRVCPACGADLDDLAGEAYEQKLIRALHHPEPTVPVRAATILGELGSGAAVDALIEAAVSSADPLHTGGGCRRTRTHRGRSRITVSRSLWHRLLGHIMSR